MINKFQHSIELRVRYSETDKMGYCYYGNYATYFEVGRVETLRNFGLSYKELEDSGVMLPVKNFEVEYHFPAFYDDLLTVETTITQVKGPRLFFEYTLYNADKKLVATAKTTLVFVSSSNMRPIMPPAEFLVIWEKHTHE